VIEPRAAIASYDPLDMRYTLIVSHQTPFPLRTQIAECLQIPEQRLRVGSPDVGGAFGVKGPTYPEEVTLVWAARRIGRPVRWECRRAEMFLSDAQARDHVTSMELALDADGHFLAIRVEDLANLGAYVSSFGAGPPIFGQTSLLCGAYRTRIIAGRVRIYLRTPPRRIRTVALVAPNALHVGTHCRHCCPTDRHFADRFAPAEYDTGREHALAGGNRSRLCQRRFSEGFRKSVGALRLRRFPAAPCRLESERKAPRVRGLLTTSIIPEWGHPSW
jgi:hypothetical protein